jgi:hypothetical protein
MTKKDKAAVGRREFLRTIGAGAGLAATAAVPLAATPASAQSNDEKTKARYRDSDHVKAFYRVNSYPTKS